MSARLDPGSTGGGPAPFFLDSPYGRLFAIHHRPTGDQVQRGHILCIPPFNEEMNRCRSMVTLQAQAFAAMGIGTLVIDLHGTGDSAGHYGDARWDIWQSNVDAGIAWLDRQPGACRALWGIRLGAVLAVESARRLAERKLSLLLWQPVSDGKQYFTQFLRMKIAAQMDRPNLPKETTTSMRTQLAGGQAIEIAGYEVHPELARALDNLRLADIPPPALSPTLWLEQASAPAGEASPASQRVIEAWSQAGAPPSVRLYEGPPFWQLHERAVAAQAIAATTAWAVENWASR